MQSHGRAGSWLIAVPLVGGLVLNAAHDQTGLGLPAEAREGVKLFLAALMIGPLIGFLYHQRMKRQPRGQQEPSRRASRQEPPRRASRREREHEFLRDVLRACQGATSGEQPPVRWSATVRLAPPPALPTPPARPPLALPPPSAD